MIQTVNYQGTWRAHPNIEPTTLDSTYEFAKNFFLYIPRALFHRTGALLIAPSSFYPETFYHGYRNEIERIWHRFDGIPSKFKPKFLDLECSDGAPVGGISFIHQESEGRDIPTILFFKGNGDISYTNNTISKLMQERNEAFNIIAIDYRPQNFLNGTEDLILDGVTAYQYVKEEMGISDKNIHIFGHSLGGGIAGAVKARCSSESEGKLVISRSFSSLSEEVESMTGKLIHWTLAKVATFICNFLDWEFDTNSNLDRIESPILSFNHSMDPVITQDVGLSFRRTQSRTNERAIEVFSHPRAFRQNSHNIPLEDLETVDQQDMFSHTFDFLLGIPS